jgi:uncharacterized protein (DUF433 family)
MPNESRSPLERISCDPSIMVGKPVVKGTRIPVEKVLFQLGYKFDLAELFAIYPELTVDDVQACIAYGASLVASKRRRTPRQRVKIASVG